MEDWLGKKVRNKVSKLTATVIARYKSGDHLIEWDDTKARDRVTLADLENRFEQFVLVATTRTVRCKRPFDEITTPEVPIAGGPWTMEGMSGKKLNGDTWLFSWAWSSS